MSGFESQLRSFSTKTGINFDKVLRKVVIDLTTDIVSMTPVGNPEFWLHPNSAPPGYTGGHARSNYFWGVQRVTAIDPTIDKSGAASMARAFTFASSVKAGGVCYITNNLPYMMALEYGHSQRQAPHGMARIAVARAQKNVNAIVRAL